MVNETKTESELIVQYKKREIEGELQRMQRLNGMKQADLRNQIKDLKEQIEVEALVKEKIDKFINKKREMIQKLADDRDKLKDKRLDEIAKDKEDVTAKRGEAQKDANEIEEKCRIDDEERRERQLKAEDEQRREREKIQQRQEMEEAARYIQKKWNWYQIEGKTFAKKKKGKKGKKKK